MGEMPGFRTGGGEEARASVVSARDRRWHGRRYSWLKSSIAYSIHRERYSNWYTHEGVLPKTTDVLTHEQQVCVCVSVGNWYQRQDDGNGRHAVDLHDAGGQWWV